MLINFAKFTGKNLYQSLFFNKVALQQVFSCEFCEISDEEHLFYRTPVDDCFCFVESDPVKYFNTFKLISSEMPISRITLCS